METKQTKETSYWGNQWKIGTRVCATDGEWTIGWGKIISINSEDSNWAEVELEKDGKIVSVYKGYAYREAKSDKESKHFPRPEYNKCNAGHQLVEVYNEKYNKYDWDCPICIKKMKGDKS